MKKLGLGAIAAISALVLSACSGGNSGNAAGDADSYPANDVSVVVSYAAGGPTDIAGRVVSKALAGQFGKSFVVENVEGASGAIGAAKVSQSRPNGLTIGVTTASAASRVPLIEDVGFTLDQLTPVGVIIQQPGLILVPKDSPYQTAQELFAAAKEKPDSITIGAAGAQTPQAVEILRLSRDHDVPLQLVPFQGDAPAITAMLGGNVDAIVPGYGDTVANYVATGEFRPLALLGPESRADLPGVPTLVELGYTDLIYGLTQYIMVVPAETPAEIVAKLEEGLQAALEDPQVLQELGEISLAPSFIGSEALASQMRAEVDALGPVLKELFG